MVMEFARKSKDEVKFQLTRTEDRDYLRIRLNMQMLFKDLIVKDSKIREG